MTDTLVKTSILPRQRPDHSLTFVLRMVFSAAVIRDTAFVGDAPVEVTRQGSKIVIRRVMKSSLQWPFETPRSREFIFSCDFLAGLPEDHYSKVSMSAVVTHDRIEIEVPEHLPEACLRKIPAHFIDSSALLPFQAAKVGYEGRSAQVMALEQSRLGKRLEVVKTDDLITFLRETGCEIVPINGVIWRVKTSRHARFETFTLSDLNDLFRRRLGATADVMTAFIVEGCD